MSAAAIPETTLALVQLRASQINGCSVCVDIHTRERSDRGRTVFHVVEVNGGPGALVLDAQNRVAAALGLEISDGQIQRVMSVVNPDKLAHLSAVSNLGELLSRGTQSDH